MTERAGVSGLKRDRCAVWCNSEALFVLLVIKLLVSVFGQMTAVGITENVKGDVKKFEIWYSGREEVYVVQVRGLIVLNY